MNADQPDNELIVTEVRNRVRQGANIDEAIRFMRDSGLDVMDSIEVLFRAKVLGLGEAKVAVFRSAVWADVIDGYNAFHEAMISDLETGRRDQA